VSDEGLQGEFSFGRFSLRPRERSLRRDGAMVPLGARAFDLLHYFVAHAGEVIDKQRLLAAAWPDVIVEEGSLRVQIAALRRALDNGAGQASHIASVPMRGYCFVVRVEPPVPIAAPAPQGPAPRTASGPPEVKGLPARLCRTIGRDAVIAALVESVRRHRLVTVVGAAGIGKTTVAIGAAQALRAECRDGVHYVDLSGLAEGRSVPGAVAASLGIAAYAEDPTEVVVRSLAQRSILLVLDNCEHVIEALAHLVERVHAAAPSVMTVATSREPLRTRGEWVLRLQPLALPPADSHIGLDEALTWPAVELFVERAQAYWQAPFREVDVACITRICRHLDGVPLAIELAAARLDTYGLEGLLDLLDDRFRLLGQGRRTALPRHQTLRATLDWSHELLSAPEQRVLRRLSVFRERFSLDSAAAVCADETAPGMTSAAADASYEFAQLLSDLVAKSLVCFDPGDPHTPYRLLESTRSYAAEKLDAQGERAAAARLHAMDCCALLDAAVLEQGQLCTPQWLARHARRIDDVRAALSWAFGPHGDASLGARLTALSAPLWLHLGLLGESMAHLRRACEHAQCIDDARLAFALWLHLAFGMTVTQGAPGDVDAALARCEELAQRLPGPQARLSSAWLGFASATCRGEYRRALTACERFGEIAREAGDAKASLVHHRMKALCLHHRGDQHGARKRADLAMGAGAQGIGLLAGASIQLDHRVAVLTLLSRILWLQGRPSQALVACADAIDAAHAVDHMPSLAYALAFGACPVAIWSGEHTLAQRRVDALHEATLRHGQLVWQSWHALFDAVTSARRTSDGVIAPPYLGSWLAPAHVDMLVTLGVESLAQQALARVQLGESGWCAAEIYRAAARCHLADHPQDTRTARQWLDRSAAIARRQGALAWGLRTALTQCALDGSRHALAQLCSRFVHDEDCEDLRAARALLQL